MKQGRVSAAQLICTRHYEPRSRKPVFTRRGYERKVQHRAQRRARQHAQRDKQQFFRFHISKSPSVFYLLSAEGPIYMLLCLKIEAEAYAAHVRGLFGKLGYGEIVHVNNKILAGPAFEQGVF